MKRNTEVELMTLKEITEKMAALKERILSPECTPRDAKQFFQLATAHDIIMQVKGIVGQQNGKGSSPTAPANSKRFKTTGPLQYTLGRAMP